MALYNRVQLDGLTLTQARSALASARTWRQRASTPGNRLPAAVCRTEALSDLAHAAELRRRLTLLRKHEGSYLACSEWETITTRAARD